MRFFSGFSTWMSKLMLKLSQFPGLGFLAHYVETAKVMKLQFGDHVGDYEVYLDLGKGVARDVGVAPGRTGSSKSGSRVGGEGDDTDSIYDDYEYDENDLSTPNFRPGDDYPVSDDGHNYYDDDYQAR
jgi:hypothetical protein